MTGSSVANTDSLPSGAIFRIEKGARHSPMILSAPLSPTPWIRETSQVGAWHYLALRFPFFGTTFSGARFLPSPAT